MIIYPLNTFCTVFCLHYEIIHRAFFYIYLISIYFSFNKPENTDSRSMSQIGMSCIGISIGQLLSHTENLAQEITSFQCESYIKRLLELDSIEFYDSHWNDMIHILMYIKSAPFK